MKNRISFLVSLVIVALMAFAAPSLMAQAPRTMSYQGVLADPSGKLMSDGTYKVTIRLYDDVNASTPIFSEDHTVYVSHGVFNVMIGSVTTIPSTVSFDKAYFLGMSVNDSPELTPRTALASTPYAMRADVATNVAPGAKGVVNSLNGTQGDLVIKGDGATTVTQKGNVITIGTPLGIVDKGGNVIQIPTNVSFAGDLTGTVNTNNSTWAVNVNTAAINNTKLASGAVTPAKVSASGSSAGQAMISTGSSVAWGNPTPGGSAGGDLAGTYPNPSLASSGVTPATYGSGTQVPVLTVDSKGRVTSAASVSITGAPPTGSAGGDLSGSYPSPSVSGIQGVSISASAPTVGQALVYNGAQWAPGAIGAVQSVSVVTANGVSGSVANPTTTPAITLTLGAITPSSVAATGTVTGSNLSGTNSGDVTLGTANGLSLVGQQLSLATASGATTGALSSSDWTTFNNKQTSSLANGAIWVGNGSGTAAAVTPSGDVTISNTGATTIGSGAVTSAKIADGTIVDSDVSLTAGIDATKIGTGVVDNTEFSYLNNVTSNIQTQLDSKVGGNAPIVGATKTKITYDSKGLVTAGADATTSDIAEGSNLYYTDSRARSAITTSATGLSYTPSTGVLSLTPGYVIPTTTEQTNWNDANSKKVNTWSAPLQYSSGTASITQANASTNGFLSSTDWSTFNAKEPAITPGTTAQYWRGDKTWQTLNTTVVPEGTNLYFTDARARAAININSSLTGTGDPATPFGINLGNANTWTATQTLPTTAAQGDALIASTNSGTTTVNAVRIGNGLTNTQVNDDLTINGGTVDNSPVGATTPSTAAFTTLSANSTVTFSALPASSNSVDLMTSDAGVVKTRTVSSLNEKVTVAKDATLNGDGLTATPLGINLGNANTWTATQTLPTTAAQGDALIASTNSGTTTVNAVRIGNGLTNTQVNDDLTINGGTVDNSPVGATTPSTAAFTTLSANSTVTFSALPAVGGSDDLVTSATGVLKTRTVSSLNEKVTVAKDATMNGDGLTATPLGINLGNANTWTATQTLPTTAAQGDALIASTNSGTTTVNAVRIGNGLTNTQVNDDLTINGGTVDNSPVGATTASTGRFTTITGTTLPASSTSSTVVTSNGGALETRAASGLAIAGDVTGTLGATTVAKINGATLGTTTATDKNILVANGTSWNSVAMSGDVTISNSGATTIGTGAVNSSKIADGTIVDADVSASAAIAVSKLAALTASKAVVTNAGGVLTTSTTSDTQIGYLSTTTSDVQVQLDAKALKSTAINTTSPLQGGGDLSTSRMLTIADAAANSTVDPITFDYTGGSKGAATFDVNDFNDDGLGTIMLDYVNAQKANGTQPGFLSELDWTTFNNKVATTRQINTTSPLTGGGDLSANRTIGLAGLTGLGSANQMLGMNSAANGYEYKTIDGTTNQVTVTHGAGSITLSTPQNIHTGASPTFAGMTLSTLNSAGVVHTNASGVLSTSGVTSADVVDGAIVDADINASAAIADTKLATISSAGKVANSATTATNSNTASTIVARDGSGNFSAGTITATLNGNATNVTGTVAIANGGTGQTTANAALNALLPSQASNATKFLQTDGTNATWTTVDVSGSPVGGDLSGTVGNATVAKIRGVNVSSTAPTANQLLQFNGTNWVPATVTAPSINGWDLSGNSGTDSSVNYLGTADARPLVLKANGTERMRITSDGILKVSGGTSTLMSLRAGNAQVGPVFEWRDNTDSSLGCIGGNGFFGIGTNAPQRLLHVKSDGAISAVFEGNIGVGTLNPAYDLHLFDESDNGSTNMVLQYTATQSGPIFEWQDENGNTLGGIGASGNLGIGVASPTRALEVASNQPVVSIFRGTATSPGFVGFGTQNPTGTIHVFNESSDAGSRQSNIIVQAGDDQVANVIDLLQLQQNDGTVTSSFDPNGNANLTHTSYSVSNAGTTYNVLSGYTALQFTHTANTAITINLPSTGVSDGKILYVRFVSGGASSNATFTAVKPNGTNHTTVGSSHLTFLYIGGAWRLMSSF